MIVWNGFDIICLVVVLISIILFMLIWLWNFIQSKIDKYFEKRNEKK